MTTNTTTDEAAGESITLHPQQWNLIMDVLRVDLQSEDASDRFGDLRDDMDGVLQELMRQLGRDGIERSPE